jgi:hydroxypyruvate isomerase
MLKKLSCLSSNVNESATFIHSNYDFNYAINTSKELIQLNVAQYEMKQVYFNSRIFHKFAKDVIVTARAERLIEKQLIMTQAIENARKVRVNQSKKFVQRKNVIRVKNCRRMIIDRKEKEDRLKQKREMRVMSQQRKR